MISTGLTVSSAIESLVDTETDKQISKMLVNISQNLRRGESLAHSIKISKPTIKSELIEMIESAELNGKLPKVLKDMNLLLDMKTKIQQRVTNALIYPFFLFVITLLVVNIILTQVIPQFALTFQDAGANLPSITQFLFDLSYFMTNYGVESAIVLGTSVIGLFYLIKLDAVKNYLSDLFIKIPYLNKFIIDTNYNLFCRQMSINLLSGLQIDHALELSINSLPSISLKKCLKHIPEEIRKGSNLSKELKSVGIFPAYSLTMISAGEETGQLVDVFDRLSTQLNTQVENSIERLSKLIEPTIIIIIGIVVSVIAFGILSPILTMNEIV
ncbi:type II secretion system F family protein [Pelagibacteraceae bacterium]|nr:type II secretion system F family protein [Pelagibacteraceae bacterium]